MAPDFREDRRQRFHNHSCPTAIGFRHPQLCEHVPMLRRTTFLGAVLACVVLSGADTSPVPARALNAITPEGILKHIRVLASDEFEGRAPCHPGRTEEPRLHHRPVQGSETGARAIPMAAGCSLSRSGASPAGGGEITVKSGDADFPLTAQDYRVTSSQPKASIEVADSPIVFAGYGIVAPEYKWDDYKGIDVKGKAVVILAGDPPIPDPCRSHQARPQNVPGLRSSPFTDAPVRRPISPSRAAPRP